MTPGRTPPERLQEEGLTRLEKAAGELGPEQGGARGPCAFSLLHTLSAAPAQPCPPQTSQGFPGFGADMGGWALAQQGLLPAGPLPPRIHAEFQLSEPPDFPFWFSPGQFTGHIILSKDATHVRDFRLFVPNHRWELGPKPPAPGSEAGAQRPAQSLALLCSPEPHLLGETWS